MAGLGGLRTQAFDAVGRGQHFKDNFMGMTAHQRHQLLISDYMKYYGGAAEAAAAGGLEAQAASHRANQLRQTDMSALQQGHRFIRTAEDDAEDTLAARLAQKYYSRLFKEYCIADLSRYRESKLGLRWRSQKEVVAGKGHFSCGAKGCDAKDGLVSYEVNFAYQEAGREKQALVKLRVCPECAFKLNYRKEKQFRKAQAKALPSKKEAKRGRAADGDGAPSSKAARYTDAASEQGEDKEYVVPPPCRSGHYEEQVQQQQQQQQQWQQQPNLPADNSVWENKAPVEEVVNLDEELDTYFDGMFA
uniref:Protein FRA10AC1 n=1 Tax=Dunaliella tertiolecta TaxID=3047 RepID=A0A7S3QZV7_DUNTE|mmetsp:Transcript_16338/g.44756  ORF Transcript_16338/g.44756 Transcript_16338/m.44756 type:complete len:304 (+) Transcript_16338:120-1031(+)|eukprot:CAMPEP_0202356560 /NCGR_PEP_ID=MMETSP1126-20121109/10968_1 /ASSEMBLY_ACC=CAM_ASM_000457 /TAXON_ID=3047 /ORGANISM="Dunaliella tertiolecta, Strain CCMP1320" /LENGTH=303 /DNA_ID=CAMNT_0048949325 /DNA_START=70 /DNA_END=981 /DNA_ORIENTATION=-